ncbi:CaiB/BaiF CoA transferase family protein [Erythrobacter sp. W53]|uniref:CaiB/BaiF CoA transferase family protein n=1 Tax=Erythrobacter sp. W53 TaxID=3425947 RepID=UPI003D769B1A
MSGDLSGIVVVSIEQAVAAPYASMRLAADGARVIKVERPEGDFARNYDDLVHGHSAYFVWLNRGKESVCLDLKDSKDKELLKKVIAKADVLIQNLKPGTMRKLGLAIDVLRKAHPKLICCSISGFGEDGPYSDLKAYDLIVQAEAGLCSITGTPENPARVGVSVCDISAGMSAHAAILQALFKRERTGEGTTIEVSLFDALADWMNVPYLQHRYGDFQTKRSGVNHPSLAPYGAYETGDGRKVIFSVQNEREWIAFRDKVMDDAALADDLRFATNMDRLANRRALDELIAIRFAKLTLEQAIELLEESSLAYGRLNSIGDLAQHPHLRTVEVVLGDKQAQVIAPGIRHSSEEFGPAKVPGIGANTDEVWSEFSLE